MNGILLLARKTLEKDGFGTESVDRIMSILEDSVGKAYGEGRRDGIVAGLDAASSAINRIAPESAAG